jgi:uncharacterized membrane protein YfcA
MLAALIPSDDPYIILFIVMTFILSGSIKGFLGIGMPSTVIGLLTLVMDPIEAISILIIPLIFVELAQYLRAPNPLKTAIDFRFFAIALILSIFITSYFITSYPTALITVAIGFAMIIFSLNFLFGFKLPIGPSYFWQILIGIISGVLGGLSSIWSPPVAMYLIARGFSKEQFLSIAGFLFLSGCLPLAAGLYLSGVLTLDSSIKSIIGLIAVFIGFRIGEILRNRVATSFFRKAILIAFLIMGMRLIIIGLF